MGVITLFVSCWWGCWVCLVWILSCFFGLFDLGVGGCYVWCLWLCWVYCFVGLSYLGDFAGWYVC